jgi:hypothetical protein
MPLPDPSVSIINMRKLVGGRYVCDLKLENCDGEKRIFIMNTNDTTREIYQFTNIEFTEDNLPAFHLFCGSNLSGKTFLELLNDSNIKVASIEIDKKMCEDLKPQTGGRRRGRKSRKSRNRKSRKHCNRKSRRR